MIRSLTLALLTLGFAVPLAAAEDASPVGRQVADFALRDFYGKQHSLADYHDSKLLVLALVGTECPLARLYGPRLAELHARYAPRGVAFVGINPNVQDSITEIAAYARVHGIGFPILKDVGNHLADKLDAVRTPEVYVLDEKRTVRYWGRIDDQYGIGYVREEPRQQDLAQALDELLAGKPVSVPETESVGCLIGRVREPESNAEVTYAKQISRILQNRCVECHREGEIAPFSLTDYREVAGWAEMIEEVVRQQRMPPWHADPKHGHFANDRALSDDEKRLIYRWVADGAPQGDLAQLPPPREFTEGWQLPEKPDVVFTIQSEPYRVKAEGEVAYQWFSIDPGFTEDKWIKAAEILPGNRAVVHHILAFSRTEEGSRRFGEGRGYLTGYVPGLRAAAFPPGMAKRIPAGSKLAFQVHYTPIGREQTDQSKIGFVFADPEEITHEVQTTSAATHRFAIPPGADNHAVEARSGSLDVESLLLSMSPHMHLRGKSFRYEAQYADGRRETLLDVPHYDFNWQTAYRLSKPLPLPPGTRIGAVAHFDNSPDNLNNPDPTQTVKWGDQTWDEMMIGYFNIATPIDPKPVAKAPSSPLGTAIRSVLVRATADRWLKQHDKNGDGKLTLEETPDRQKPAFGQADQDGDKFVTRDELIAFFEKLQSRAD